MPRKRANKSTKQTTISKSNADQEGILPRNREQVFDEHEVERQIAAIRALRDVEIEQLRTTLRLLRSCFSAEQLQVPVLQLFKENLPNVSIAKTGEGHYEVKWRDEEGNLYFDHGEEKHISASLLHRLSTAYPDYAAGLSSLRLYDFSNRAGKMGLFGIDQLHPRSLVLDEPSDSQILEPKDGLQTPNVNSNRLSVHMTPKSFRNPKYGEVLLSVRGSPLGVYKEDNMETIQEAEAEDG